MPGVPLVVVESPYRALTGPLEAYLDVLDSAWPPDKPAPITFVVLPEYVARRWWERILYNQSVKRLRSALLGRPHTVVVNVPYRREDPTLFERAHRLRTTAARARPRRRRRRRPEPTRRTVSGSRSARRAANARDVACNGIVPLTGDACSAAVVESPPCHRAQPRPRSAAPSWRCRDTRTASGWSASSPRLAKAHKAELIGVHVVEIDWSMPLDMDVAGRSEEIQQVLDRRRGHRRVGRGQARAGPAPGPRRRRGARRRGRRARGRPARRRARLSNEVRRGLRHRADDPVRPEERTLRSLGRARADPGGDTVKTVIVGCGRVGLRPCRRVRPGRPRGHRPRHDDDGLRPPARHLRRRRRPRRRHRRGHPPPGRRRVAPTSSWP